LKQLVKFWNTSKLINVLISTKLNSSLVTVITNFKKPEATVSGFLYTHYITASLSRE